MENLANSRPVHDRTTVRYEEVQLIWLEYLW
jgi:hypothetical protein